MSEETDSTMRGRWPVAWSYHTNTSRWSFNALEPEEGTSYQLPPREYPGTTTVLPAPLSLDATLDRAIGERLSCRRFSPSPLGLPELATLLYHAYGIRGRGTFGSLEFLERPVPSGGALYPLELYLLASRAHGLAQGIYHYAPMVHALEEVERVALPEGFLSYLFMGQYYVAEAAGLIVVTGIAERLMRKYGDRGYRYMLFEAGHVAQNIALTATALGLGSLCLGGFFDQDLATLLGVDPDEEIPLYAVAVGTPVAGTKTELRLMPEQ